MDLIPIFSLIVLVATIGTFILAVGAYIMFRLRERHATTKPVHPPATFDADVYAPQMVDQSAEPRVVHLPDTHAPGDGAHQQDNQRRWR